MIRQAVLFLIRGPGTLRAPAAKWIVTAAALAGAAMLVWSAVIHLMLWADGYKDIHVIGPLFLIGSIVNIILALAVVALRRLAALAAGAGGLLATAGGLLLSVHVGLFGFTESLAVPYAMLSLWVEFAGAAVLALGALLLAVSPQVRREQTNPSRAPSRT